MKARDGQAKTRQTAESIARGERLREFRKLFGYTQEQTADLAGLPRTDVTRLEGGWNKGTATATHQALGRAFKVWPETIAELLDGHVSPGQARARSGEALLERSAPSTHSPRLRERPEWSTVLAEATVVARAVFGEIPATTWAEVGEVLDSPPFPRPLTPGFLANLAHALLTPDGSAANSLFRTKSRSVVDFRATPTGRERFHGMKRNNPGAGSRSRRAFTWMTMHGAGTGSSLTWSRETYAEIAREARARAVASSVFPSPSALLAAGDLRLRVVHPWPFPVSHVVTGTTVLVGRGPNKREDGWSSFLGVADALLERWRGAHTSADVVLLAAEIAAPSVLVRGMTMHNLARAQRHVPRWVLRAWRSAPDHS